MGENGGRETVPGCENGKSSTVTGTRVTTSEDPGDHYGVGIGYGL